MGKKIAQHLLSYLSSIIILNFRHGHLIMLHSKQLKWTYIITLKKSHILESFGDRLTHIWVPAPDRQMLTIALLLVLYSLFQKTKNHNKE